MQPVWNGWSQSRSLGALLQSPAHRVLRVLQVTGMHWQVPAVKRVAPASRPRLADSRVAAHA